MEYYGKKYEDLTINDKARLEAELKGYDVVKDKLRYVNALIEDKSFTERKTAFETNVKNRVFYRTHNGRIELVRPYDCTEFGIYNSCKVSRLSTTIEDVEYSRGTGINYYSKDTQRVDSFHSDLIEIKDKKTLDLIRETLHGQIDQLMNNFNIDENHNNERL